MKKGKGIDAKLEKDKGPQRPKWFKVMNIGNIDNDKVDLLYDIPTALFAIYQKVFNEHKDPKARKEAADYELQVFMSRLTWLLVRYGLDEFVKVL